MGGGKTRRCIALPFDDAGPGGGGGDDALFVLCGFFPMCPEFAHAERRSRSVFIPPASQLGSFAGLEKFYPLIRASANRCGVSVNRDSKGGDGRLKMDGAALAYVHNSAYITLHTYIQNTHIA